MHHSLKHFTKRTKLVLHLIYVKGNKGNTSKFGSVMQVTYLFANLLTRYRSNPSLNMNSSEDSFEAPWLKIPKAFQNFLPLQEHLATSTVVLTSVNNATSFVEQKLYKCLGQTYYVPSLDRVYRNHAGGKFLRIIHPEKFFLV